MSTNDDMPDARKNPLSLADQVEELITVFETVSESAEELTRRVDEYQTLTVKTMNSYRNILSAVASVVFLLLCLTALGGYLVKVQNDNTQHINELQSRTSSEVLCPLYGLLINSITANPEPTNLSQQQREFRQQAAQTFKKGYKDLGCVAQ